MRQSSGSVVCPGCGRLVDVDEPRCPNCGRWRPGMFGYAAPLRRMFGSLDAIHLITGACVLLYVLSLVLDPGAVLRTRGIFSLLSPSTKALYLLGMTNGLLFQHGHWYTVLSATFLHGSILHILFNMLWVRSIAPLVENSLGPARFFLVYMAGGASGYVLSNLASGNPTVGASGAIFGLLAASIVLGRAHGGSMGQAVSQQALSWAVLLFVLGFLMPITNNWAHGGGFAGGWVATRLLLPRMNRPEGPVVQLVALVVALATVAAVVLSFLTVPGLLR